MIPDAELISSEASGLRPESAEELYREMLARCTSARKRNNLENVWTALEHLREVKAAHYTVAAVARAIIGLKRAGPKAQSIRNSEGADYRMLISAYAKEHGAQRGSREATSVDNLVAAIGDLQTAAIVRGIISENKSLKRRLDLLKNAFSKLPPVDVSTSTGRDEPMLPRPVAGPPPSFTPTEITAVRSFLARLIEHQGDLELTFEDRSGALLWREGTIEIAGAGFRHALLRIAEG